MAPGDDGPRDLHEWVSFEDPHEDRTWVFDLTFLESAWACIYGRGCHGVLTEAAPELEQGCCSYGAHFVDDDDRAAVAAAAERLDASHWQFKALAARRGGPARRQRDGVWVTRLVEGACIFLNRPGFPGGAGCALHTGALAAGERPMDWKPDVCWQVPVRRHDSTDDHGHVTSTVREWKRRDWGEGGHEFHWWCTDTPDAFVERRPVWRTMEPELRALVGDEVYATLATVCEARRRSRRLPHPALRRAPAGRRPEVPAG